MPRKNMYIAVALAIVVVAVFIFFGFFGVRSSTTTPPESAQTNAQALLNDIAKSGSVSELRVVDTAAGSGVAAKAGDQLTVNYTGVLPDGTVFDATSLHNNQPFTFTLGAGAVIKGWDQGLVGMHVGGSRLIAIPPDLAYGPNAIGKIPANASLIFEVQLLAINGQGVATTTTAH